MPKLNKKAVAAVGGVALSIGLLINPWEGLSLSPIPTSSVCGRQESCSMYRDLSNPRPHHMLRGGEHRAFHYDC